MWTILKVIEVNFKVMQVTDVEVAFCAWIGGGEQTQENQLVKLYFNYTHPFYDR